MTTTMRVRSVPHSKRIAHMAVLVHSYCSLPRVPADAEHYEEMNEIVQRYSAQLRLRFRKLETRLEKYNFVFIVEKFSIYPAITICEYGHVKNRYIIELRDTTFRIVNYPRKNNEDILKIIYHFFGAIL